MKYDTIDIVPTIDNVPYSPCIRVDSRNKSAARRVSESIEEFALNWDESRSPTVQKSVSCEIITYQKVEDPPSKESSTSQAFVPDKDLESSTVRTSFSTWTNDFVDEFIPLVFHNNESGQFDFENQSDTRFSERMLPHRGISVSNSVLNNEEFSGHLSPLDKKHLKKSLGITSSNEYSSELLIVSPEQQNNRKLTDLDNIWMRHPLKKTTNIESSRNRSKSGLVFSPSYSKKNYLYSETVPAKTLLSYPNNKQQKSEEKVCEDRSSDRILIKENKSFQLNFAVNKLIESSANRSCRTKSCIERSGKFHNVDIAYQDALKSGQAQFAVGSNKVKAGRTCIIM